MRVALASCLLLTAVLALPGRAEAGGRAYGETGPSSDAVELGALAPAASRSTTLQLYGDAAIARSAAQRRFARRLRAETPSRAASASCEPRIAEADGYVCGTAGSPYRTTPSYVSSPQVAGQDHVEQAAILPPVTSQFYAFDALVSGQAASSRR